MQNIYILCIMWPVLHMPEGIIIMKKLAKLLILIAGVSALSACVEDHYIYNQHPPVYRARVSGMAPPSTTTRHVTTIYQPARSSNYSPYGAPISNRSAPPSNYSPYGAPVSGHSAPPASSTHSAPPSSYSPYGASPSSNSAPPSSY